MQQREEDVHLLSIMMRSRIYVRRLMEIHVEQLFMRHR